MAFSIAKAPNRLGAPQDLVCLSSCAPIVLPSHKLRDGMSRQLDVLGGNASWVSHPCDLRADVCQLRPGYPQQCACSLAQPA